MADLSITPADVVAGASARTWQGVAGEAITPGSVVYLDVSAMRWRLAGARSETAAARRARGIALTSSSNGQPIIVARPGMLTVSAVLTPGKAYYLSSTPGKLCDVADLSPGLDYVCLVGIAVSSTVLQVDVRYPGVAASLPPGYYVGQVATRSYFLNGKNASATRTMSRTKHMSRDSITSLRLAIPNWYVTNPGDHVEETDAGGTATVKASVEYPAGTFTQVQFGGSATLTQADGATTLSDAVAVTIPRDSEFWIRVYRECSAGILYTGFTHTGGDNGFEFGGGEISDKTASGTVTAGSGFIFAPCAIIGVTNRPSVYVFGDSITLGQGDTWDDDTGDLGQLARTVGGTMAYINTAKEGDALVWWLASHAKRLPLAQYCSHVISAIGVNDVGAASRTAAQVTADIQTLAALFPGKPFYQCTLSPNTTSTDGWLTAANQTVTAKESTRVALNTNIRTGIAGVTGVFDNADVFETSRNSGKWISPYGAAGTADGLHPNLGAYLAIKISGVVNVGAIRTDTYSYTNAEARRLVARFTTPPSDAEKALYDTYYTAMKAGALSGTNLLNAMDADYVAGAIDAQAAQRNLIQDRFNLRPVSAPVFTRHSGYVGDAVDDYLKTYCTPGVSLGSVASQNSVSFSHWSGTDSDAAIIDFGSAKLLMLLRFGNAFYSRANNSTSESTPITSSLGEFAVSRTASGSYQRYRNGVAQGAAQSTLSEAVADSPVVFMTANTNTTGGYSPGNYSSRRFKGGHIARGLTANEKLDHYNAKLALITGLEALG